MLLKEERKNLKHKKAIIRDLKCTNQKYHDEIKKLNDQINILSNNSNSQATSTENTDKYKLEKAFSLIGELYLQNEKLMQHIQ